MLPEYAVCRCGEHRRAALRKDRHEVICRNCADRRHPRGFCPICFRLGLPIEKHHVRGREFGPEIIQLCLNCHSVVSALQYEWKKLVAKVEGVPMATGLAVVGSVELIVLSWRQACLRTESFLWRLLSTALVAMLLAAGFVGEALP